MDKLIQECKNPKLKDFTLPKVWSCEPQTVIRLDFSTGTPESFDYNLKRQIVNALYQKEEEIEFQMNKYEKLPAVELLSDVCDKKIFQNIVLLIDEYDARLNDNLFEESKFENLSKNFYKPFFTLIKAKIADNKINKCVVTGILKFSNVGIFSGFYSFWFNFSIFLKYIFLGGNQFWDLSLDASLCDLIGFTESEVVDNFLDVIKIYCDESYIQQELKDLKINYNGYKFNNSITEKRVYSPVSVIKHLVSMLKRYKEIQKKKSQKSKFFTPFFSIFYAFYIFSSISSFCNALV